MTIPAMAPPESDECECDTGVRFPCSPFAVPVAVPVAVGEAAGVLQMIVVMY